VSAAGESPRLTHVDARGQARMVDVSAKAVTTRTATARGRVLVSPEVVGLLRGEGVPKGDALAVARIAGIAGAKRTPDLVPLCHPVALHGVSVELEVTDTAVEVSATARTADRTGVEMEALTAVAVAGLTLVDMVKAVDKGAVVTDVRVVEKTGGRSGTWRRDEGRADEGRADEGRADEGRRDEGRRNEERPDEGRPHEDGLDASEERP
jgi:cyclic pyranopterin phosphate synthase